jgi:hypothetical protein
MKKNRNSIIGFRPTDNGEIERRIDAAVKASRGKINKSDILRTALEEYLKKTETPLTDVAQQWHPSLVPVMESLPQENQTRLLVIMLDALAIMLKAHEGECVDSKLALVPYETLLSLITAADTLESKGGNISNNKDNAVSEVYEWIQEVYLYADKLAMDIGKDYNVRIDERFGKELEMDDRIFGFRMNLSDIATRREKLANKLQEMQQKMGPEKSDSRLNDEMRSLGKQMVQLDSMSNDIMRRLIVEEHRLKQFLRPTRQKIIPKKISGPKPETT